MNRRSCVLTLLALPFGLNSNNAEENIMPAEIPGIKDSGYKCKKSSFKDVHIQQIDITVNLKREEIFKLGHLAPYFRYSSLLEN